MKVSGLDSDILISILGGMRMFWINVRGIRQTAYEFKLRAIDSHTYYSRKNIHGRYGNWVCFHGWRDFIRVCFANGATKVATAYGTWKNAEEFDADLPRIEGQNVGSESEPRTMPELCTHEGGVPPLLRRAVKAVCSLDPSSEAVA